jgi:hypothetical protein
MKEFPQQNIMTNFLKKGTITEEIIDEICDILIQFYQSGKHTPELDKFGEQFSVKKNIDENFEQTTPVINVTIPKKTYDDIKKMNQNFFEKNKKVFSKRIQQGHIHDCHGDLHSGNIVVHHGICIFDCIEFNKRFRYIDIASDIGFLAMDLDYQNHPHLASYLIDKYIEKSNDLNIYDVLNFYKSYRAYVRGKVIGFQLNDPNIKKARKKQILATTRKYFDLSHYYALLTYLDINRTKPLLFLVGGLTGTGKSTIALKIAVDYHAHLINTDIVRKELAGIDRYERHHDKPDTGLYAPEKIDRTYKKVIDKGASHLKKGENIVLDATFQKIKYREMAQQTAEENHADFIQIECICPDNIVKKRLEQRLQKKTVSDGRWEIYLNQKETYEPCTPQGKMIKFDTSNESYEHRMKFFKTLVTMVNEE